MSYQDKIQHHLSALDKELSKYPLLVNLEKQTGAPKVYVIGGVVAFYLLLVTFNFGGQLLTNLAGFLIPGYYSMATLFSLNLTKIDDTIQWLTYWTIFGFFNVLESAFSVTYWIPFYYTAKLLLLLWAGLPQFNGSQAIFKNFLQPLLAKFFVNPGAASANLRAKADVISGGLSGDLGSKVDGVFNKSL